MDSFSPPTWNNRMTIPTRSAVVQALVTDELKTRSILLSNELLSQMQNAAKEQGKVRGGRATHRCIYTYFLRKINVMVLKMFDIVQTREDHHQDYTAPRGRLFYYLRLLRQCLRQNVSFPISFRFGTLKVGLNFFIFFIFLPINVQDNFDGVTPMLTQIEAIVEHLSHASVACHQTRCEIVLLLHDAGTLSKACSRALVTKPHRGWLRQLLQMTVTTSSEARLISHNDVFLPAMYDLVAYLCTLDPTLIPEVSHVAIVVVSEKIRFIVNCFE
jgi:hypothetical protein